MFWYWFSKQHVPKFNAFSRLSWLGLAECCGLLQRTHDAHRPVQFWTFPGDARQHDMNSAFAVVFKVQLRSPISLTGTDTLILRGLASLNQDPSLCYMSIATQATTSLFVSGFSCGANAESVMSVFVVAFPSDCTQAQSSCNAHILANCPVCSHCAARWEARRMNSGVVLSWHRCVRYPACPFAYTLREGVGRVLPDKRGKPE